MLGVENQQGMHVCMIAAGSDSECLGVGGPTICRCWRTAAKRCVCLFDRPVIVVQTPLQAAFPLLLGCSPPTPMPTPSTPRSFVCTLPPCSVIRRFVSSSANFLKSSFEACCAGSTVSGGGGTFPLVGVGTGYRCESALSPTDWVGTECDSVGRDTSACLVPSFCSLAARARLSYELNECPGTPCTSSVSPEANVPAESTPPVDFGTNEGGACIRPGRPNFVPE
jgi:hypothetical protein